MLCNLQNVFLLFQEYQSFTDLQFSYDKAVTAIDWHPTVAGCVAVAVAEKSGFDDRVDQSHRIVMTPSLILLWSFSDPIHPQVRTPTFQNTHKPSPHKLHVTSRVTFVLLFLAALT